MLIAALRLLEPFFEPPTLVAILFLAATAAMILRRWRVALGLQIVALLLLLVLGILPGGVWLALPLEQRYPPNPPLPDQVAGIVVLGGTERTAQSAAWGQPILSDPTPIIALLALSRRYPNAKLVFTGGGHSRDAPDVTEARIVREFLDRTGFDTGRILFEDRAQNTLENATFTRDLVRPARGAAWLLVTQAISLPRAVAAFDHAGWTVIPYPAGYLTNRKRHLSLTADVLGQLKLASVALHEWGGLIAYRLMGYTDALLPD